MTLCSLLLSLLLLIAPPEAPPEVPGATSETSGGESAVESVQTSTAGGLPGVPIPLPSGAHVAIVKVEGEIYGFTLDSLERRVDRAIQGGATIVVIEIDTLGGQVISALEISKYIKAINITTVAWINDKAYSAGTIIASACNEIVMSGAATLGDSAPIMMGQNLSPTERAKALSPILEEYRDSAQRSGYDYALFHAMCELGIEVYQVQHMQTQQVRFVNQSDYAVMVRGADPDAIAAGKTGGVLGQLFGSSTTPGSPPPPSLDVATAADQSQWKMVKKIHDGRTLLTMNQTRSLDTGISKATVRNETELRQYLGAQTMGRISQTWSEDLAAFLTHPAVQGVLIVALLIGGYTEMQAPGIGLPGAVAVAALVLLLGAPLVIGLAEVWHILLFVIGLVLLIVEVLFTPTFGLLGIAGLGLMFGSFIFIAVPIGGQYFQSGGGATIVWDRLFTSSLTLLISLAASFVGFYFLTKHFGSIPLLNRLMLDDAVPAGMPQTVTHVSGDEAIGGGQLHVGDTGQTATALRPTGEAIIKGQTINVETEGGWIDINTPIRIVEVHGNRIVVDGV